MITIFTHTRGSQDAPWLEECLDSVEAARCEGMNHVVSIMQPDYTHARWKALQSDKFVGFVDDDDKIRPEAVRACFEALDETGAGVAFTQQMKIDAAGNEKGICQNAKHLHQVCLSPQGIHHFALIRRDAVHEEALEAALEIGIGIDWLIKANAAMRFGAVHVPIVGYDWRVYDGQDSQVKKAQFEDALPRLNKVIHSWMRKNLAIKIYGKVAHA